MPKKKQAKVPVCMTPDGIVYHIKDIENRKDFEEKVIKAGGGVCPGCNKPIKYTSEGRSRTTGKFFSSAHFSHLDGSSCGYQGSNESIFHAQHKKYRAESVRRANQEYEVIKDLEIVPEKNVRVNSSDRFRRPDISLIANGKRIMGIEVEQSHKPRGNLVERHFDLLSEGIVTEWDFNIHSTGVPYLFQNEVISRQRCPYYLTHAMRTVDVKDERGDSPTTTAMRQWVTTAHLLGGRSKILHTNFVDFKQSNYEDETEAELIEAAIRWGERRKDKKSSMFFADFEQSDGTTRNAGNIKPIPLDSCLEFISDGDAFGYAQGAYRRNNPLVASHHYPDAANARYGLIIEINKSEGFALFVASGSNQSEVIAIRELWLTSESTDAACEGSQSTSTNDVVSPTSTNRPVQQPQGRNTLLKLPDKPLIQQPETCGEFVKGDEVTIDTENHEYGQHHVRSGQKGVVVNISGSIARVEWLMDNKINSYNFSEIKFAV